MGSRRNIGYLFLVLIVAGAAVAFNLYADDEAQKIVENAPEEQAEVPEIDQAACEREQAEFEVIWDASIENPNDPSYEEQLEIALSEVNAACGIE